MILSFILLSCIGNESTKSIYNLITPNFTISISLKKSHQFLREYKRSLTIVSSNNSKISSIELQSDIGTGANSYLYDQITNFLLIDCNGNWYSIDKKNGDVSLIGNFWGKKNSDYYLGTFLLEHKDSKIKFIKQQNLTLEDIYVYGGG